MLTKNEATDRELWCSVRAAGAERLLVLFCGHAQNPPGQQPALPRTLGLDQGYLDLDTPDFFVKLVDASQTVAAPYTGDYGPNFFGHALTVGTYLIDHPEFGWQAFGGNVTRSGQWVNVQPLDSFRKRVYLAPVGLWLVLDAGTFEQVSLNTRTNAVRITLSPADPFTTHARLRVQQPARITRVGTYAPRTKLVNERDAFTIPLRRTTTSIELSPNQR